MSFIYVGVLGLAYTTYYLYFYGKKNKCYVNRGTHFGGFLVAHVNSIKGRYLPLFWCTESRLMTVLRCVLPIPGKHIKCCRRDIVPTIDGGQFGLDWYDNSNSITYPDAKTRPTIVILPGVTSTPKSYYLRSVLKCLHSKGYRCVMMIYRGLDGVSLKV